MSVPSDTYMSFVLSRPLQEVWIIFLLGLARLVPIIAMAPFLGGKVLSNAMKIGLGIALVILFLPFLIVNTTATDLEVNVVFMFMLAKEALIGFLLGFIISMPFFFVQSAGALIDHQRGAQSLQVMNPITQMKTSPTGTLYNDMMLVSFFWIGGPLLFFDAIFTSFHVLPSDQFLPPSFFDSAHPIWITMISMMNTIVRLALQLAAPSLIAMLLSDLFLGIANRMAPQVQISFLLWSLKALIGIAMIWLGWWLVIRQMDTHAISWTKGFQKIVQAMG